MPDDEAQASTTHPAERAYGGTACPQHRSAPAAMPPRETGEAIRPVASSVVERSTICYSSTAPGSPTPRERQRGSNAD